MTRRKIQDTGGKRVHLYAQLPTVCEWKRQQWHWYGPRLGNNNNPREDTESGCNKWFVSSTRAAADVWLQLLFFCCCQYLTIWSNNGFRFFIIYIMHLMHVKMKCCILFFNVFIKTGKRFFGFSGKVSLSQIRWGKIRNCGGFSGGGNVPVGSIFLLLEGDITRNKEVVGLV